MWLAHWAVQGWHLEGKQQCEAKLNLLLIEGSPVTQACNQQAFPPGAGRARKEEVSPVGKIQSAGLWLAL